MLTKEMTVLDVVEKFPTTEEVFAQYDEQIGKCLLCNCLFDSLQELGENYKIDLEELMDKLNRALKN